MSVEPMPFQRATIEAAIRAFRNRLGSHRFLVADEVGLGKTVVACGIIERISRRYTAPLRVFYVCSNLAIATQNLARLVSFLPDHERHTAIAKVDRPSLMPTREPPTHRGVQVFSLTPDTALPSRRRRREGRVEERAFGYALLNELLQRTIPGLYPGLFALQPESWLN
ncbi:MAG: DEAD/DEAH box helicase family protein [Spirochaetaceae bacterium]|nr:DEAD/DEAH box helicase family protein [Spirochaetaceae bacterium]